MISIINKFKIRSLLVIAAVTVLASCNKDVQQFPTTVTPAPTGLSLAATIAANANFSLFNALITRSGMGATISNTANTYTMFVADNNGMKQFVNIASGGLVPLNAPDATFLGFIGSSLPAASAAGIVSYNICPQALPSANFPTTFPNLQYPSILNPAPTVSAFLRLTTFPSKRGATSWLNSFPINAVDMVTANGVIHTTASLATPPSTYLWDKINTDPALLLFKAAIQRADADPTAPGFLQGVLLNIGANLTVFAPDTTAMKNALSFLSGGAIPPTAPNSTFSGFIATLPIATVKGIVVYHMLGSRAFSVNLPTTATNVRTLLNGAVPTHPGVSVQATFVTVPGYGAVTATATVKGILNPTASNITSKDNHYLNGTLHTIDQLLLPQ